MSNSATDNTQTNTVHVSHGHGNLLSSAVRRKPPKKAPSVLCKAWKFRCVVPCTTNLPAAFEKDITKMLETNRPKQIAYLVVRYNARQLPQDLKPMQVTIQGFLQGRQLASTLRKWHNFDWSPVQGGLCGDLEFEGFRETTFPYITVTVVGTLRLNLFGRSELFQKKKVIIFHCSAKDFIRFSTRLNERWAAFWSSSFLNRRRSSELPASRRGRIGAPCTLSRSSSEPQICKSARREGSFNLALFIII